MDMASELFGKYKTVIGRYNKAMGTGSLLTTIGANSESIKDVSTIIFSLVATLIAIFTYINARKTLFQPVRSEVIKKQTELLTKMLETLFEKPVEMSADYQRIITLNVFCLMEECGFILENHGERKAKVMEIYSGDKIFFNENGVLEEYESIETFGKRELSEDDLNRAKKKKYEDFLAGNFKINRIRLSIDMQNYLSILNSHIDNPFLPIQISSILSKLVKEINYNIEVAMRKALLDFLNGLREQRQKIGVGTKMPVESAGVFNEFNHIRADHRPVCTELRKAIRHYLRIDEKW